MTYEYRHAEIIRVVDGDTVEISIDLGNKTIWKDSFRINGIDTPERGQISYREAAEFLSKMLAKGVSKIVTHKPDKYGRWLVDIWVPAELSGDLHVNTLMIESGFAKSYDGGRKI